MQLEEEEVKLRAMRLDLMVKRSKRAVLVGQRYLAAQVQVQRMKAMVMVTRRANRRPVARVTETAETGGAQATAARQATARVPTAAERMSREGRVATRLAARATSTPTKMTCITTLSQMGLR